MLSAVQTPVTIHLFVILEHLASVFELHLLTNRKLIVALVICFAFR